MNRRALGWGWIVLMLGVVGPALAETEKDKQGQKPGPVLEALSGEVARAMQMLGKGDTKPYFISAEVVEVHGIQIISEEGGLQGSDPVRLRRIDVDIRIGTPALDSTHALRSERAGRQAFGGGRIPFGDQIPVLRRAIWKEINGRFAEAKERWAKVESELQTLVKEKAVDDLASAEPTTSIGSTVSLDLDTDAWRDLLRRASSRLATSPVCFDGSVRLIASAENRWFVSSEGTRLRHGQRRYRLSIHVNTVAPDGDQLNLQHAWEAHDPQALPKADELFAQVDALEKRLAALRKAPAQEPYTGPAILSGRASAVFFHEILGHRLEGHRLKRIDDAQTFVSMVGKVILPAFLSVHDDPTLERYGSTTLFGHYLFDNQGVPSRRVTLVDGGVLEGFLESRSPSSAGKRSNGHGRRQTGFDAVTRQGNLVVSASKSISTNALRSQLIELVKKSGLEYGLQIEEIQGGFTFTGRSIPNAFNVKVVDARRVYVDGRPDELIRGLDFIGTPLVTFSRIVAAGQETAVFNGFCGAESGSVPVSGVGPALLLSQVETQRKALGQSMPPLLPPPLASAPTGRQP